jgi:hypothetical protein
VTLSAKFDGDLLHHELGLIIGDSANKQHFGLQQGKQR